MARVIIDPSIFSERWFGERVEELIRSPKVRFVFVTTKKGTKEVEVVGKALEFRSLMLDLGRVDIVDAALCEERESVIANTRSFNLCKECDDPHIFATIYMLPTKYVFSPDRRMAGCRSKLVGKVSGKYLGFVVVATDPVHLHHRPRICS